MLPRQRLADSKLTLRQLLRINTVRLEHPLQITSALMRLQQRLANTSVATRQHRLHHRFLQRLRNQLNASVLLQAIVQHLEALLKRAHIAQR